jgi:hypothetical protein
MQLLIVFNAWVEFSVMVSGCIGNKVYKYTKGFSAATPLIGKTRMKFRFASVRISYALLHLREIPRFLSTQGASVLLAFNLTLIQLIEDI